MSIDLSQFYEVFYEESFEGLDVMESELLELEPGDVSSETINKIFRAAHSIKGGSGTFGFTVVSDFTHVLETLLDQIRNGERELEPLHVELLLQSVDCLRDILAALQSEQEPDQETADQLKAQFQAILDGEEPTKDGPVEITVEADSVDDSPSAAKQGTGWHIVFIPDHDLFKTGNEPIFMLEELAELGEMTATAEFEQLPAQIEDFDPEECYLSWHIDLVSDCSKDQIDQIFEWVVDESDIRIEAVGGETAEQQTSADDVEQPEEEVVAPVSQSTEVVASKEPVESNKAKSTAVKKVEKPVSKSPESASIRVGIDKVDSLINMVGELVITQAMLNQLGEGEITQEQVNRLQEGLAQLAHNTRDLQESVMQIRMMPISFVFSRFPRVVRDTSLKLGKKIELNLIGEQTELDKTVMEKIADPMVHLVRNSLDHGIETPEKRLELGKPEHGTVTLNAFHQGGNIVIEIIDDGAGINTDKVRTKAVEKGLIAETDELTQDEIHNLIFQPGFSTADTVSDISGRGVGMDVVRRNIEELNGTVEVTSIQGEGSTFTIRLPLTLAILDGQLIRVGQHIYIIPLVSIVESLQIDASRINQVAGGVSVLRLRDEYIPIICLFELFGHKADHSELDQGLLVIVESDNSKVGVLVDDLLAQQQVVIKSLEANYQKVEGISGATILGDGTVSLIIDISGLLKLAGLKKAGLRGLNINAA